MAAPTESLTGSCLCGAWRYTVLNQPLKSIICHCISCKKWTGASFMPNVMFPSSALDMKPDEEISPPPQMTTYPDKSSDSGRTVHRRFCASCGSPLYCSSPDFPGMISLATGTIDGRLGESKAEHAILTEEERLKGLAPEIEFYCKRAAPWVEIKGVTTKHHDLGDLGQEGDIS
ncbi:uncharacterized protein Z520_06366 [Fonsecaea multimorphosa CBS 102226]|uniref:CENP-V/GFA domain-containing protein n=1 Tax=Fonsecaea multimorphosa CBS 102226 TaxID=1442371 RepID=A0A0D2K377_9EURO|nr:uncharacterized protein Z520_06366 [Fonsecaea multimorphosa CBS 102226]KIX97589.1 hypothetical protein Z520_06366 [Fonsecaea multimorphosa CBS 102226]OAL24054.1 hypothetical protein AYO22_05935 [Fonsecaea multimorphosa]